VQLQEKIVKQRHLKAFQSTEKWYYLFQIPANTLQTTSCPAQALHAFAVMGKP
jgi:hypothetical protein